jgi:hypothetical protein
MPRRWWTLVAVGLATFMTYLDNNVAEGGQEPGSAAGPELAGRRS